MNFLIACSLISCFLCTQAQEVSHPFFVGDTWRGHLSNCQRRIFDAKTSSPHVIDMTVQSVHEDGILDVLFTEQTTKTQYLMTGVYDPKTLQIDLKFSGEWIHRDQGGWVPCDARGVVSKDLSTLTGDSMCTSGGVKKTCAYAGGGEFILRHDRTKFQVAGAGDSSVNGVYTSVPKNHDLFDSETYEGVPIYKQVSCETTDGEEVKVPLAKCTMNHVLAQRRIGSQKFWIITDISSLNAHKSDQEYTNFDEDEVESASVFDSIKYSAWSEEVTPPDSGWRKRNHYESRQPAPLVHPVVSTMFELQQMAHPLHRTSNMVGDVSEEGGLGFFGGILLLGVCSFIIYTLFSRSAKGSKSPHGRYVGHGGGGGGGVYSGYSKV
ncbi:hypothetical protein TrST_g8718 [Triparma strigata]|uniref:Uncharacterized protein n=2 Tax=Triparma strigata TaxID=1606541 RepID=A0A9W6ZKA2_9STRA|nr:hypothetical protein TrST_g8718 [Triparma strigata]